MTLRMAWLRGAAPRRRHAQARLLPGGAVLQPGFIYGQVSVDARTQYVLGDHGA